MKTVFKNEKVAHIWASQSQEHGRGNGSISFRGDTLYSYSEPIGRIIAPGVVLLCNRNWSNTTSCHQGLASAAVSHMKRFYVYSVEPDHERNLANYADRIKECYQLYFRARERKASLHESNHRILADMIEYAEYFDITPSDVSEHILKLDEEGAKAQKIAYDVAQTAKREQIKADRKAAQKQIDRMENDWINGRGNGKTSVQVAGKWFSFGCTRLRLKDGNIETSRNASAPQKDCRVLWKAIKAGKPVRGLKVGMFTVTSCNGDLVIGCHTIPRHEVDRLALSLGW